MPPCQQDELQEEWTQQLEGDRIYLFAEGQIDEHCISALGLSHGKVLDNDIVHLCQQEELQEELTQQLEGYGIDPYAEGLTDEQYTSAMAELGRRRQVLMAGKTPEEQRRIQTMRNNMMWHLNNVSAAFCASCLQTSTCSLVCILRQRANVSAGLLSELITSMNCSLVCMIGTATM